MKAKTISGAWDLMPDHGAKPVAILDAERAEREIAAAALSLAEMKTNHSRLADAACCRLYDIFGLDGLKALHAAGSHWWMVERMLEIARTEGLLRERKRSPLPDIPLADLL